LKSGIEKKNQFNKKKKKRSKQWASNWKKITYHKFGFNDEIKNKLKFYIRAKKKLKIRKIRIKFEISINKRIPLKIWMIRINFEGKTRDNGRKERKYLQRKKISWCFKCCRGWQCLTTTWRLILCLKMAETSQMLTKFSYLSSKTCYIFNFGSLKLNYFQLDRICFVLQNRASTKHYKFPLLLRDLYTKTTK
jgi:hypothetical protein